MAALKTITKEQYSDGLDERLAASQLERTDRINARYKAAPQLGIFAFEVMVRVTGVKSIYGGIELTLTTLETGETSTCRVNFAGLLYRNRDSIGGSEDGYLINQPLDELDDELDDLVKELTIPIERVAPEPLKESVHIADSGPLPIPRRWLV